MIMLLLIVLLLLLLLLLLLYDRLALRIGVAVDGIVACRHGLSLLLAPLLCNTDEIASVVSLE